MMKMETGLLQRLGRDRRGVVAIIVAILIPVLAAGMAIVIDIGFWRYRQTVLQEAVDAAAVAVQYNLSGTAASLKTQRAMQTTASTEAQKNGWSSTSGSLTVNNPPHSGPNTGNTNYVEIILTQNAPRLFSGLWLGGTQTLSARAVAAAGSYSSGSTVVANSSGCLLATGAVTAPGGIQYNGSVIEVLGTASISSGCEVISDSSGSASLFAEGAPAVISSPATTVGGIYTMNGGLITGTPQKTGQPSVPDPYGSGYYTLTSSMLSSSHTSTGPWSCAGVWSDTQNNQTPYITGNGSATDRSVGINNNVIQAGHIPPWVMNNGQFYWDATNNTWRYSSTYGGLYNPVQGNRVYFCHGITISNTTVTFDPGTYIMDQNISFSAANIILNNATLVIGPSVYNWDMSNTNLTMISPPSGIAGNYSQGIPGFVWTQMSDDTTPGQSPFEISNGTVLKWRGSIHMPTKSIRNQANGTMMAINASGQSTGSGVCSQIIVNYLGVYANVAFYNDCSASMGVKPFGTSSTGGWTTTGSGGTQSNVSASGRAVVLTE